LTLPGLEPRCLGRPVAIPATLSRVLKGKAISVRGRGGPMSCETSRLPHFPHNGLTDGVEVVSFTRRPPFTSRKRFGTHFCLRLSRPQGHSAAGMIKSI
jgi:hypothetical protein